MDWFVGKTKRGKKNHLFVMPWGYAIRACDGWVQIYQGNCLEVLALLPEESIQCVVTSPPYWGLRKYEGEQEMVWGDNHCKHQWNISVPPRRSRKSTDIIDLASKEATKPASAFNAINTNFCSLCGAWRGAYGLEPTPEMYVEHTLEFLRAIRRVLRKDGVVFWNIGDSYAGSGGAHTENQANPGISQSFKRQGVPHYGNLGMPERYLAPKGLKSKDLCLIPFRVAIAAQEDGWWVRSVIIWSKPNPMPESVKDRPTESHEYILMLTKSKNYYWDMEAVREAYTKPLNRWGGNSLKRDTSKTAEYKEMLNIGYSSAFRVGRPMRPDESGRNIRTVWEFPTRPYPEAHFAVFPEELPKRCIMAATSEKGNCSKCGKPWVRVVERIKRGQARQDTKWAPGTEYGPSPKSTLDEPRQRGGKYLNEEQDRLHHLPGNEWQKWSNNHPPTTLGWKPQCTCDAETKPAIVLDPFAGAGTVGKVAKSLGRQAILIDLSEKYCELARKRVEEVPLPISL